MAKDNNPDKDSFSPFDDDIASFFDRASSFTKKLVGHTYDWTSDLPSLWPDESLSQSVEDFINKPYSCSTDERRPAAFGLPFPLLNAFGSFGDTPFGLHLYSNPSARKYNECMRKNGESLWDADGNWRCLFPSAEVANKFLDYKRSHLSNHILTKEDFQDALAENPTLGSSGVFDFGPKGTFFKEFNAYLNWKNTMLENVRRQREELRNKLRENSASRMLDSVDSSDDVMSYSMNTVTNFDPETNQEVRHETRTQTFKDGRTVTRNITKSRAAGSSEWVPVSDEEDQSQKAGWLWSSK